MLGQNAFDLDRILELEPAFLETEDHDCAGDDCGHASHSHDDGHSHDHRTHDDAHNAWSQARPSAWPWPPRSRARGSRSQPQGARPWWRQALPRQGHALAVADHRRRCRSRTASCPGSRITSQREGGDILRSKGILAFKGEPRRFVYQGVHMMMDGDLQREWKKRRASPEPHRLHRPQAEGGRDPQGLHGLRGLIAWPISNPRSSEHVVAYRAWGAPVQAAVAFLGKDAGVGARRRFTSQLGAPGATRAVAAHPEAAILCSAHARRPAPDGRRRRPRRRSVRRWQRRGPARFAKGKWIDAHRRPGRRHSGLGRGQERHRARYQRAPRSRLSSPPPRAVWPSRLRANRLADRPL